MTHREIRDSIRDSIKALVEQKVAFTRDRKAYKLRTRPLLQTGEITEKDRRRFFCDIDDIRADLKSSIRHGLLLYGFLMGRDYKTIEQRCASGNDPSASEIFTFIEVEEIEGLELSQADIEAWLDGAPSPHRMPRRASEAEAA